MEKHIYWAEDEEKEFEKRVLAEYSSREVQKHLEYLTALTRLAGTEDELKAAKYINGKLEEYGLEAEIHEFDAYISHPGKAELQVLSPVQRSLPCFPHAFIGSTPPTGVEAELIPLGKGSEEDYEGVDARGRIVLIAPGGGAGQVEAARIAEEKGARAQVHITDGRHRAIKVMQMRSTWGNPTPETMNRIPEIPAISICAEDGRDLAELARKERVVVRLAADAWRGYRKVCQPVGTLRGMREPEKYVLFGAHYCGWFLGATDNATSNALMLEMARVFSKQRENLRRGIRFAWWTGHTQGTFAGSTWYLDNFWEDIRDNAIAYLNMDTVGKAGSSGFTIRSTEEIRKFHEMMVREALGMEIESGRFSKIGDQSFWGMGLPSLTGNTLFPDEETPGAGGGSYWYMHAAEDTLDKVDIEIIRIPAKVYSVTLSRLCNNPVLPFEFVTMAKVFKEGLKGLMGDGKPGLDLTPLTVQAGELEEKAATLNKLIEKHLSALEKRRTGKGIENKFGEINRCLVGLSRILFPILYSRAGKYGQDPMGTRFRPIPALQPLNRLKSMAPDSDECKALRTHLLRERNRVSDALNSASRLLEDTLNKI